jgi:hypothetical protein
VSNTLKAAIAAVVADGIAVAVAFGAHISTQQQILILAFVGSITTLGTIIFAYVEKASIQVNASWVKTTTFTEAGGATSTTVERVTPT